MTCIVSRTLCHSSRAPCSHASRFPLASASSSRIILLSDGTYSSSVRAPLIFHPCASRRSLSLRPFRSPPLPTLIFSLRCCHSHVGAVAAGGPLVGVASHPVAGSQGFFSAATKLTSSFDVHRVENAARSLYQAPWTTCLHRVPLSAFSVVRLMGSGLYAMGCEHCEFPRVGGTRDWPTVELSSCSP